MNAQPDTELRRPLWRRLLRWATWICASLAGLGVLILIVLVAINWQDEALTPEAQAWLAVPPNTVPDAENAWLAMIAIGVEKQPGTTVGRQIIERLKESPNPPDMAETYLSQFGPAWQNSGIDASLCNVRQNGPDVLPCILAKQAELKKLVSQQQPALARYYAAIALPGFHEEDASSMTVFLPYAPGSKAASLARIDLALRLQAGDRAAEARFAQHMHYWLTALEQSHTLLGAMIATTQIRSDQALLQGMLENKNRGAAQVLQSLRGDLQDFSVLDESAIQQRLLAGELRLMRNTLDNDLGKAGVRKHGHWVLRLVYHPQATLNQQQFMMTHPDESATTCDMFQWHYAYNPIGKILACIGAPRYQQYFVRIRATQDEAVRLLAQSPGA
ncbi:hypothetical protein Q9Q94_07445 [Uliginosibacterium sp. 31-16]|uniref:hypothetical protein n=1 Tax=Uliginosibacterium sp. 31-16 TaxID=3068315 RepID=UPI00273EAC50|nr:hypothetical protein [Uliginosibacterium sp. 31-16]MDP5239359.1 hypothetical protein [Uliginosibacterium sp. 31-16]